MSFQSKLLGRVVEKSPDSNERMWPSNWKPNMTGQFLGVVEAAWVEDKSVKVAVRNPIDGTVAEVWLVHHKLQGA